MTKQAKPIIHARDHEHGGSDPVHIAWEDVGGGGSGGGGARVFGAGWAGPYPLNILTGATWKVPKVDGADVTFDLDRMLFRLETPATSGTTTVHVEKSTGGGAFAGSTVGSVSLSSGSYEGTDTTSLGSVSSGDLLRIVWDAVGTGARGYLVMLEGTAA